MGSEREDIFGQLKILIDTLSQDQLRELHLYLHTVIIGLAPNEESLKKQILLVENEGGAFTLDRRSGEIFRGLGRVGHLSPTRLRLFLPLAEQPDVAVDKTTLICAGWPNENYFQEYLHSNKGDILFRITIRGIRAELNRISPGFGNRLRTIERFGYEWIDPLKPTPEKMK